MTEKQLVKLLKSGNFTIAYHNNGQCSIYEGRMDYEQITSVSKEVGWFTDSDSSGYLPKIVELLVEALNGKSTTI